MEDIGNIDSKYRYVILAAKRAKQLLKGAKPKVKTKTRNLIRIAQTEVSSGLIDFEILPTGVDEIRERLDQALGGEEIAGAEEHDEVPAKADESEESEAEDDEDEAEEESLEGEV